MEQLLVLDSFWLHVTLPKYKMTADHFPLAGIHKSLSLLDFSSDWIKALTCVARWPFLIPLVPPEWRPLRGHLGIT